jgi:hypothetical protein
MDVVAGFFWFFYLLICPIATFIVFFAFVLKCESVVDLALRTIMAVLLLSLMLGPIWTEVGPMPWWNPHISPKLLNPTTAVQYLIWQYAAVCAAAFVLFGFVAVALRMRRARNQSD